MGLAAAVVDLSERADPKLRIGRKLFHSFLDPTTTTTDETWRLRERVATPVGGRRLAVLVCDATRPTPNAAATRSIASTLPLD